MPRVGLLGSADGWHLGALARAFGRLDLQTERLDPLRLVGRIGSGSGVRDGSADAAGDLEGMAAVLVRLIPPGSLEQVIFRIDCLHAVADRGVPVVNSPRAVERTVDKHWTSRLVSGAGLPTPRTIAVEGFTDAMRAFEELGGDVVVKPLFGSGGRGIFRVGDPDLAYRSFRALELQRAIVYLQRFVPHGRSDLRLFVIGDRVIAAARRRGDGWKTNVAAGAEAEPHRPRPAEEDLALRACRAIGADYAGVDLIETDDDGLMVVEVNGIPGWKALQGTTTVDIALEIARLVAARIATRRGATARG